MHAARQTTRARSWRTSWEPATFLPKVERSRSNLIFLVEGEEEIGSDNLGPFLERHRAELDCDVIVISDTGMAAPRLPHPHLFSAWHRRVGIHCAWSKPRFAFGRIWRCRHEPGDGCRAVSSQVFTIRKVSVAIDGFYNDVRPLLDWEREAAAALPITDADIRALAGVAELAGEPGFSAIERVGARPTAEVNGMGGGYQGEGTKTVLPREAFAKLTFRFVPNQKPEEILRLAEAHLRAHCPKGVRLEILSGHGGEPYYVDPNSVYGKASLRALERVFGRRPALMREGGSIPIVTTFKKVLGADSLLLALAAPDCRAHSPNENFPLENFFAGMKLNQAIIEEIGRLK